MKSILQDLVMKSVLQGCYNRFLTQRTGMLVSEASVPHGTLDFSGEPFSQLNDKWFEEFIVHPQINSVLVDAMRCCFWAVAVGAKCNQALLDNALNWCIGIMQNVWNQGDDAIAAFRCFWDALLQSQDVLRSQRAFMLVEFASKYEEKYVSKVEKRLQLELQQDFVPQREDYMKIRCKYTAAVKTYYCNGFIYMLGEFKFNDFYIPPLLVESNYHVSLYDYLDLKNGWKNIFDENDILYIIGIPGSGKSLFLRNMINNYADMTFRDSQDYLIIYCDMKAYYTNGNFNKKSVPDFLQESIINTVGMENDEITIDFIRYYLQLGRCIVLMDALDEVPKENRMALHKKVVSFFKTTHPNNKICITSRARGFLPQGDIKVLHISELTSTDISNYLEKMIALGKFKAADKENFLIQAQVLIDKHFLTNFLTLSLMVNIYKAERELPENKIELYKKCFEYIAKKREMEKGSRNSYDWDKVSVLMKDSTFISLSTLAAPNNTGIPRKAIEDMLMKQYRLKYCDEAATECAIRQFLEFCSSRTDLFVLADTDDQFKFFHRSFFEYFYSRYITQQGPVEKMYGLMSQFDESSEVFELVIALVKDENEQKYQELINLIFDRVEKEIHAPGFLHTAFQILTLAMPVIDDAFYRNKYVQIVTDNLPWMTSKAAQQINQAAITIALKRCFQTCPGSADIFQQKYRSLYICNIVKQFQLISKDLKKKEEATHSEPKFPFLSRLYSSGGHAIPFYICAYPGTDALQEELVNWSASDIQNFLSATPGVPKRRSLQKSLCYFGQCAVPHRRYIFDVLLDQSDIITWTQIE